MSLINLCSYGKKLLIIIFLSFSTSLFSQVYFNDLEGLNHQKYWIGLSTIDSGAAHSGYYLSHTDSLNPYGLLSPRNYQMKMLCSRLGVMLRATR